MDIRIQIQIQKDIIFLMEENSFYNKKNIPKKIQKDNLDKASKNKSRNELDDLIGDVIINGNSYHYSENIDENDLNNKSHKDNNNKNNKDKDKNIKFNGIIDKDSKIKVEQNNKNIFKKKKKRSNSYNDNMGKIFNKNLEKNKKNNNNNEPKNKYKIPSLNYLKLNQINKLNCSNKKKNIILYNNIIKPFHNTITLNDNENKNIKMKIKILKK